MNESIENGIASRESYLPGPLKVKRRAPGIYKRLMMGLADYAGLNSVPQIKFASPSSRKAAVEGPTTPEGGGGRGGGGSDASSLSSSSLTSTSTTSTSAPTPAFGPARRPFATAGKRSLPALE